MATLGYGASSTTLAYTQQALVKDVLDNTWNRNIQINTLHKEICEIVNDVSETTTLRGDVSEANIKKFTGEMATTEFEAWTHTLKVHQFYDMFRIPRHTRRFDTFDRQLASLEMMALQAALFPDKVALNALAAGTQLTHPISNFLLSTAHRAGAGTQSNLQTAAFGQASLEASITAMDGFQDSRGLNPLGWCEANMLILNKSQRWNAIKWLGSDMGTRSDDTLIATGVPTGAAADKSNRNQFADVGLTIKFSTQLYSTQFILVQTNQPIKPLYMNKPFTSMGTGDIGYEVDMWADPSRQQDFVSINFYIGVAATPHWYLVDMSCPTENIPTLFNPETETGVITSI